MMFKYLLLKTIYDISYVDVVERSLCDMSLKYFLGMPPENTHLIDESTENAYIFSALDIDLVRLGSHSELFDNGAKR